MKINKKNENGACISCDVILVISCNQHKNFKQKSHVVCIVETYSKKAWACVQNGITQRGRLADGDMPNAFWLLYHTFQHDKKTNTHLSKPFIARDVMEGHTCSQNTIMFALVFCFELLARAAHTSCQCHLAVKNPIHDGNRGQLKLPKSHER